MDALRRWMITGMGALALAGGAALPALAQDAPPAGETPPAAPMPAKPGPSVAEMLKETGFDVLAAGEGSHKVFVNIDGETTALFVDEDALNDRPALKTIVIYTAVAEVPDGFNHSPALLKRIATLNDNLQLARISIHEKTGDIWLNAGMWLRTADAESLGDQLAVLHFTRLDLRKELLPFIKE